MRSQRKTISLNKAQVTFMDAYGKRHAGKSRSEVVAEALLLLRPVSYTHLDVYKRQGACASRVVLPSRAAPTKAFGAVHLIDMAPAGISATGLRAWLARRGGGQDGAPEGTRDITEAAAMLPAAVLDYIERHQLYLET